jgi:hypothetical protein
MMIINFEYCFFQCFNGKIKSYYNTIIKFFFIIPAKSRQRPGIQWVFDFSQKINIQE